MLSLSANFQKLGDFKEIQNFVDNATAQVLVGYLSGKQHTPTIHGRQVENGKATYKGYNGEENPQDIKPMELAELAKVLTFGSATIPARPFIEEGLLSKKGELSKEIKKQLDLIKDDKTPNWNKVGTKAVAAVQEFVRGDYYKSTIPNSQTTIDYKGSDTPLIDGADLINSLEYVIE